MVSCASPRAGKIAVQPPFRSVVIPCRSAVRIVLVTFSEPQPHREVLIFRTDRRACCTIDTMANYRQYGPFALARGPRRRGNPLIVRN